MVGKQASLCEQQNFAEISLLHTMVTHETVFSLSEYKSIVLR